MSPLLGGGDCDDRHDIIALNKNIIAGSVLSGIAGESTNHNERKKEKKSTYDFGWYCCTTACSLTSYIDDSSTELSVDQTRILFKIGLESLIASSNSS